MDPAISSGMLANTTCRYRWVNPSVTNIVGYMSPLAAFRLPYADASTPAEMHADCRVVGHQLHLPPARVNPDAMRRDPKQLSPSWLVSERAAELAGSMHLHLD